MRVLVCGDRWAGHDAAGVTEAVARGWRDRAPDATVVQVPFSGGGSGFVRSLQQVLAPGSAPSPTDVSATVEGRTYLDGAALCAGPDSRPLGAAVRAAVEGGAGHLVVGIGPAAFVDGGAGLLAALGGSEDIAVAVRAARDRLRGVQVLAAYQTGTGLLGLQGASARGVESLGWSPERAQANEHLVGEFAAAVRREAPGPRDLISGAVHRADRAPGSGDGGGAGFVLATLGARLLPGAEVYAEAIGLARRVEHSELIVVTTEVFDWRSLGDDPVASVIRAAVDAARPAIVLAGQVEVGRRETMSLGASAAYAVHDPRRAYRGTGEDPVAGLTSLARRVAGTWTAT